MPVERCAYCGREEGSYEGHIHLLECPVCGAKACMLCLALIEFSEVHEDAKEPDLLIRTWRMPVCKVHVPWNIIEGIKRRAEENE